MLYIVHSNLRVDRGRDAFVDPTFAGSQQHGSADSASMHAIAVSF